MQLVAATPRGDDRHAGVRVRAAAAPRRDRGVAVQADPRHRRGFQEHQQLHHGAGGRADHCGAASSATRDVDAGRRRGGGLYKLNAVESYRLKPPGFNP